MSRHDPERLADIVLAIQAIHGHLERGSLDDGLVFDAVCGLSGIPDNPHTGTTG